MGPWSSPFTAFDRGASFLPPANLFDLNDLDADGFKNEPGERPIDRFVGLRQVANPNGQGTVLIPDDANQPDGSIAWNISSVPTTRMVTAGPIRTVPRSRRS